jgi:hypothetical protein
LAALPQGGGWSVSSLDRTSGTLAKIIWSFEERHGRRTRAPASRRAGGIPPHLARAYSGPARRPSTSARRLTESGRQLPLRRPILYVVSRIATEQVTPT